EILKSRTLAYNAAEILGLDYALGTPELNGFRKKFSVQPVQGTDFIRITYQSEDPLFAMQAVNALVDAFIESSLVKSREEARAARDFIEDQLVTLEAKLKDVENRLSEFKGTERSEEHTSELQSRENLVCRLL